MNKIKDEKSVIIKLRESQIPILLGAIFIGKFYEDWQEALANPKFEYKENGNLVCLHETSKNQWFDKIDEIEEQIKMQTGIINLDVGPQIDRKIAEMIREFFERLYEIVCIESFESQDENTGKITLN
jgi:hypothetical protein